jgi:hypothetical protein
MSHGSCFKVQPVTLQHGVALAMSLKEDFLVDRHSLDTSTGDLSQVGATEAPTFPDVSSFHVKFTKREGRVQLACASILRSRVYSIPFLSVLHSACRCINAFLRFRYANSLLMPIYFRSRGLSLRQCYLVNPRHSSNRAQASIASNVSIRISKFGPSTRSSEQLLRLHRNQPSLQCTSRVSSFRQSHKRYQVSKSHPWSHQ